MREVGEGHDHAENEWTNECVCVICVWGLSRKITGQRRDIETDNIDPSVLNSFKTQSIIIFYFLLTSS